MIFKELNNFHIFIIFRFNPIIISLIFTDIFNTIVCAVAKTFGERFQGKATVHFLFSVKHG